MTEIKLELSSTQKAALPGVEFLVSNFRRQGRTTLIAYVLLKKAFEHIEEYVYFISHTERSDSRSLKRAINKIFKESNLGENYEIQYKDNKMRVLFSV